MAAGGILLVTSMLPASAAALVEGSPAPPLTVSKWIQGEPVKAFEPGTAYLVEFWSSWWFPSKQAFPHINHLHQKYQSKGLVVIGQNVKESPDTDLAPLIKRMGNLITYRIALDACATNRLSGAMLKNWLSAAGAGIPTAFIVDKKGTVCFIGQPDEIDDALIEQILAGTFAPQRRALARKNAASRADAWEKHSEAGRLAWKAKQWDRAMSEIDQLEKLFPEKKALTQCLRITVFIRKDDLEGASKLALQISAENPDDPFLQHRVARTIAIQARAKYRLPGAERDLLLEGVKNNAALQTADRLMERAVKLLNGPEPEFLHTQAQLAFLQGNRERAIQLATEALTLAEPGFNDPFSEALESFKNGRLPP